jgi:hypothetical protein
MRFVGTILGVFLGFSSIVITMLSDTVATVMDIDFLANKIAAAVVLIVVLLVSNLFLYKGIRQEIKEMNLVTRCCSRCRKKQAPKFRSVKWAKS